MELLEEYLFSLPMIVFTIPFLIFLCIWVISLLGLLDLEIFDALSGDVDVEADGGNIFSSMGLDGVPLLVALTLVDFYGMAFTFVARKFLMPLLDGFMTGTVLGLLMAVGALVLAIPLAAICVKPLRKFFVTHEGESKNNMMGTICVVKTQTVTESFGQAEGDNGMIFSVRAQTPNSIKKGDRIALLEYDSLTDTFSITTEDELMAMSSQPHLN